MKLIGLIPLIFVSVIPNSSPIFSRNNEIKRRILNFRIEFNDLHFDDFDYHRTRTCRTCLITVCSVGVDRLRGGASTDGKPQWSVVKQDGKYVVVPETKSGVNDTCLDYKESRRVVDVSCILAW